MIILKAENISKQYRLGIVGTKSLQHDLNRWYHKVRGKEDPYLQVGAVNDRSKAAEGEYVWALKDINFEVQKGEVLGIIGKNGAGKSTLLKILSRVTSPTTGSIKTKGRIASLLEVGTGFHPELTGRENIYLNGAILGMTKTEITAKIDEIIDFSGCQMYIDTPTKRYSSGMTVRLAFAVAAFLEPDILVVDEVLAVGDAEFQKKAIGKMQDISSGEGRTVLFVSHNMASVQRLCPRAILMEDGSIIKVGNSENVIEYYLQKEFQTTSQKTWNSNSFDGQRVVVEKVWAHDANFNCSETFEISKKIGISMIYKVFDNNLEKLHSAFNLFNANEINIFDAHEAQTEYYDMVKQAGTYETTMWIPANLLSEGIIIIGAALVTHDPFKVHFHDKSTIAFNMIDNAVGNPTRGSYVGNFPGIIRPLMNWSSKKKYD